ncbi:hypothetical protein O1611_g172 [Lasiodiplodia mahajangana]|uniref:Uncharacterized protein n=1 Tax=Lasiodiplodia mahajangana TaxID=1108764 RepID=A0ACC2K1M5_9PEZI|nr:hypothetical protein O1611_g172 [Lasiodiplodia mahajangana]
MAAIPAQQSSEMELENQATNQVPPPVSPVAYSRFTKNERRIIVALIAFAGWFSTLSSFIYYPAIPTIATSLHSSISFINLTVTSYLVVSAIAPAFVGDAADTFGRRPLYVVTLTLYVAANVSIALQHSAVSLLILRMLQSIGISGTFSVAYGVIADISIPSERGAFVSAVSFGITTAPSLGPVVGGLLAFGPGWRWIFWFLTIAAGSCLAAIYLALPETNRALVGNGGVKPPKVLRLPLSTKGFMQPWEKDDGPVGPIPPRTVRNIPNPIQSLRILSRKDVAINNTLLVDINPDRPATAQASSNIVRCILSAILIAVLQKLIDALGFGLTFTILSLFCLAAGIFYLIELKYGMKWRLARQNMAVD